MDRRLIFGVLGLSCISCFVEFRHSGLVTRTLLIIVCSSFTSLAVYCVFWVVSS